MPSKLTLTATHTGGPRMLIDTVEHPHKRPPVSFVQDRTERLQARWAAVSVNTSAPQIDVAIVSGNYKSSPSGKVRGI